MKKKGSPAKRSAKARKPRKSGPKHPNPLKPGALSDKAMIGIVEEMMWGQFGCALLRSIGVKPIDLTIKIAMQSREPQKDEADPPTGLPELTGTDNSESPEAPAGEKPTE
jgi:hypothetical protein